MPFDRTDHYNAMVMSGDNGQRPDKSTFAKAEVVWTLDAGLHRGSWLLSEFFSARGQSPGNC